MYSVIQNSFSFLNSHKLFLTSPELKVHANVKKIDSVGARGEGNNVAECSFQFCLYVNTNDTLSLITDDESYTLEQPRLLHANFCPV